MRFFLLYIFISVPVLCYSQKQDQEQNRQIIEILTRQQQKWNDGDIDGYMSYYWESDSLKFIGKSGITCGWNKTRDNYRAHYPDKETMGELTFSEISTMRMKNTLVLVTGKWFLKRKAGDIGGYFTLLCKKIKGTWKIILDHTS